MDASQYLRRLAERCPKTISRSQCSDASLYTQMKGLAATTTYISPVAVESNTVVPLPCEKGSIGFNANSVGYGLGNSGSVEPVKIPAGCPSEGVCAFFTDRYTNPTVELPGCTYASTLATYQPVCKVGCVQGTTVEQTRAVQIRVDRNKKECC